MPSPIGHLIAGAAVGRAVVPSHPRVVVACMLLAAAADADLLLPQMHRTATHSLTAVVVVLIVAIAVTGRVTAIGSGIGYLSRYAIGYCSRYGVGFPIRYRIVLALVAAFASHILLDWLGADPTPPHGVQLLWPFSNDWFISGLDLFRGTARRNPFTARSMWINVTAIAQEVAILGPIAWLAFRFRRQ